MDKDTTTAFETYLDEIPAAQSLCLIEHVTIQLTTVVKGATDDVLAAVHL